MGRHLIRGIASAAALVFASGQALAAYNQCPAQLSYFSSTSTSYITGGDIAGTCGDTPAPCTLNLIGLAGGDIACNNATASTSSTYFRDCTPTSWLDYNFGSSSPGPSNQASLGTILGRGTGTWGPVSLGSAFVVSDHGAGFALGINAAPVPYNETTTAHTVSSSDCGALIRFTNSSAATITVTSTIQPPCQIEIEQTTSAQVTVQAGTGATFHSAHGYTKTYGQWAIVTLMIESNSGGSSAVYIMTGDGA